jgi:hypothetical protein
MEPLSIVFLCLGIVSLLIFMYLVYLYMNMKKRVKKMPPSVNSTNKNIQSDHIVADKQPSANSLSLSSSPSKTVANSPSSPSEHVANSPSKSVVNPPSPPSEYVANSPSKSVVNSPSPPSEHVANSPSKSVVNPPSPPSENGVNLLDGSDAAVTNEPASDDYDMDSLLKSLEMEDLGF